MKFKQTIGVLLTPLLMSLSYASYADNNRGAFVGIGTSAISIDNERSFDDADLWIGEAFAGYKYNSWLGVEARYGQGFDPETVYLDGEDTVEANFDLTKYQAVYYRAEAVNQTGRFYALLGYSDVNYELDGVALETDGFSWGLGLGFITAPHWNLNFEYKNIGKVDGQYFTAITAAVDYRF